MEEEEEATFHMYILFGRAFYIYCMEVRGFFLVGLDELLDGSI